ncbi:hypothetical protein LCGC14_1473720 [marine sediment metagenome]|uniref:Transcriptional regulator n=1 Tax=marine sediment metagenome TaxID=412755 RepID=A0A0F9LS27_9ZZZZ
MKHHLEELRNTIILKVWEKQKGSLTMQDLAYIFNLSLPQTYKIIRKDYETRNKV